MSKLPKKQLKPIADAVILTYWKRFRVGDEFKTYSIVRHVRGFTGKFISDASIGKYLRNLRKKQLLNYTYVGSKANGIIRVIEIGEAHSL